MRVLVVVGVVEVFAVGPIYGDGNLNLFLHFFSFSFCGTVPVLNGADSPGHCFNLKVITVPGSRHNPPANPRLIGYPNFPPFFCPRLPGLALSRSAPLWLMTTERSAFSFLTTLAHQLAA